MSGPTLGVHLKAPTGLPIPAPWPSVLRRLDLFQCTPSLGVLPLWEAIPGNFSEGSHVVELRPSLIPLEPPD